MQKNRLTLLIAACLLAPAARPQNACDLNVDGNVNVVDVQLAANALLSCRSAGVTCNVTNWQQVITAALGGTCGLRSVTLTWSASPSANVSGYNLYRAAKPGGPYTKLHDERLTKTVFVDVNVSPGSVYYYVATALDKDNRESDYSSEIRAAIPAP